MLIVYFMATELKKMEISVVPRRVQSNGGDDRTDRNGQADSQTDSMLPAAGSTQLIEAAPSANVAHYDARERINGHGPRGWLRAFHIVYTFALYQLFIFVYHRGWFIGKKDESE